MKVITVHRAGMIYIVMSIALGLLAINVGSNFHYLAASAFLGYMLASGIAGRRNIRKASVTVSFPDEIYARTPFLLTVNVTNTGRPPIFLIDVRVGTRHAFFPAVQPGETVSSPVMFAIESRGTHEVSGIELSSSYPFNFFTRYWPVKFRGSVTVFPAPVRANRRDARLWVRDGEDDGRAGRDDSDREMIGVRPYAEGDPMRVIHWKSTARTGRLSSRLYDRDGDGGVRIIDLDSLVSAGIESGLSLASHEISNSVKSGSPIGMSDRGRLWAPSSARADKLSMLTHLALYE